MTGIALMIFLLIWGLIALWLSKMFWRLINSFKKQPQSENEAKSASWQNSKTTLLQLALAALIFVLPVADEIIAYPRYYQLCSEAGSFQFGPGMDAQKAHGREVYQVYIDEYIRIFPNFKTLSTSSIEASGVVVEKRVFKDIDAKTGELVLSHYSFEPVTSFFAIPWNGKKIPWLLKECGSHGTTEDKPNQDFYRDLQLIQVDAPANVKTNILKVE